MILLYFSTPYTIRIFSGTVLWYVKSHNHSCRHLISNDLFLTHACVKREKRVKITPEWSCYVEKKVWIRHLNSTTYTEKSELEVIDVRSEKRAEEENERGDKQEGEKCETEKCVQMGSRGEKSIWERKKEKGLDRVELRSWTENAPRNIPDIVWEQFSRQPRTTSASHYGIKVRRWPDLCRLQPLYRELL